MSKFDIMKQIDLQDAGHVVVNYLGRGHLDVTFVPLDKTKKLVFDSSAKKTLDGKILELVQDKDPRDPKLKSFVQEYAHKMISALHKNGLCELVDVDEGPKDWYEAQRK